MNIREELKETIDLYIISGKDDFLFLLEVIVRNGVDIREGIAYLNKIGKVAVEDNKEYITFK